MTEGTDWEGSNANVGVGSLPARGGKRMAIRARKMSAVHMLIAGSKNRWRRVWEQMQDVDDLRWWWSKCSLGVGGCCVG